MSNMNKLLDGVKIEWKQLGDIITLQRGRRLVKSQLEETGTYPVFQNSMKPLGYYHESNVKADTTFVICAGAAGEIGFSHVAYWAADDVHSCLVPKSVDDKYLYYFLLTQKHKILSQVRRASIPRLSKKVLEKLQIPIPIPDNPDKSLKIQKEIVRILDNFKELTTELSAKLTIELTARKNQYCYYREQLFSFEKKKVHHVPMGDESIGEFIRGKRFVKADMISEGVPCIHYGEMYTHYDTWADETKSFVSAELVEKKNLRVADKGDVVIVAAGETIEDIGKGTAWFGNQGVVIHDACFSYKSSLNPKYVAYFTRTRQFHDQIRSHIRSGKISAINAKGLGKAIIPIVSKEEQEQIVSILDKFDILTSSISEALPKEIELRKKQYEYYREKLLTFHEE